MTVAEPVAAEGKNPVAWYGMHRYHVKHDCISELVKDKPDVDLGDSTRIEDVDA